MLSQGFVTGRKGKCCKIHKARSSPEQMHSLARILGDQSRGRTRRHALNGPSGQELKLEEAQ